MNPNSASAGIPCLQILANLNFAKDIDGALAAGAEGIGLYRTEFEFMVAGKLLSEAEQLKLYRKVVIAMEGRCVHIRLLDIQADKTHPSFDRSQNAKAGRTSYGAQFLIDHPDILKSQACAIARASSSGPVSITYPFIADLEQFLELKSSILRSIGAIKIGAIQHGVMFELPSSCLQAPALFRNADFGCIGSNDLNKYLFGVDRNSTWKRPAYVSGHPVLRTLVKKVSITARRLGRPLLFCGEMANDPDNLDWLMESGIRMISVAPDTIPRLRDKLNGMIKDRIENIKPPF
jgi:phosphoenolpyruvate-protein kinase (PTS system EI component)